mgnify:CR=1 FL=1
MTDDKKLLIEKMEASLRKSGNKNKALDVARRLPNVYVSDDGNVVVRRRVIKSNGTKKK